MDNLLELIERGLLEILRVLKSFDHLKFLGLELFQESFVELLLREFLVTSLRV